MAAKNTITSASSAEYFSKNLQQVGFSSYTKAALTTIKEAIDNSLDACEEHKILPEVSVIIERVGDGSAKSAESIRIKIEDNGPGLALEDVVKVFGEYLASSKFGRGRCSRGQQGIGISAVTTWAQLTHAKGATVVTKTKKMRQAQKCQVEVDIKKNQGVLKSKEAVEWDKDHGLSCEFLIDARIQLNGDGGLLAYLNGISLVNPHLSLKYKILDNDWVDIPRVSDEIPEVPPSIEPHPHTMKLGEFIAHSHLYGKAKVSAWLKKGFSRISDGTLKDLKKAGIPESLLKKTCSQVSQEEFKKIFQALNKCKLMAPSTKSVMSIGEAALATSIQRLGKIDFFSVVSRKPAICDFKPVLVEVAIARFTDRVGESDSPVTLLRFANRVPLQFDKAACAMTKAIESVNWKSYGLVQPKKSLPQGPYIMAISLVSPFIKFKNASKETVDASEELVEEIRRSLIQAGQRLSKHIKREKKADDLIKKRQHIEQFAPILVDGTCRILKASEKRKKKALEGLAIILGNEAEVAEQELSEAIIHSEKAIARLQEMTGIINDEPNDSETDSEIEIPAEKTKKRSKKRKTKQLSLDGVEK